MIRLLKPALTAGLVLLSASVATAQDRPSIVTVNYPLQYLAERLVGDTAEVVFPVPKGTDPSFWRPSIADISTVQSADLIVLNGAGFATWIDRVSLPRSKLVNTSAAIEDRFIVTESITHAHGDGGSHSHEGLASYTWLDPLLAIAQADAIAAGITARGLAPADEVEARLNDLKADLLALDTNAKNALAGLQYISIVATHPRYQYFAQSYGLSISALEWDAGAMPTQDEIDALRKLVAETGARVMIWEAEPPAAAYQITSELGLQNVVFETLAHQVEGRTFTEVFADALAALAEAAAR